MGQSRWIDDDQTRRKRTPSFPSHESIVPKNAQKQRRWTIIDTLLCRWDTIETVFRTIISVNQLSIYGAVPDLCEEYSARQTRTGETRVGRTIWPIVRASKIIDNDTYTFDWNPAQEKLLQKYKERVERLSQQDRVIKNSTDAGFLKTVEVGQYFTTKHADEFAQFTEPVTCRENTLPRDAKSTDLKIGFEGTPKLDPCLKSQPATCKVNMEWKLELNLLTKTILTRGSQFLMDWTSCSQTWSTKSTTTTSRRPLIRRRKYLCWRRKYLLFASQSRAAAKPRRPTSACSSTRTVPIRERIWTDIKTRNSIQSSVPSGKKTEHSSSAWTITSRRRWGDWVLEMQMIIFGTNLGTQYWSDEMWKSRMAEGGGNKKRFQYCTGPSGQEVLYLRALQGDSGRNPNDPSLQDSILIPNNFFEYIYHIGCAVSLHSITNSRLIAGGQNSSRERQTVFFTAVNPMDKDHKDPYELDLTKPRLTSYKQKKWKRHQDTVYWVDFQLAQRKGLKFYQTRCNAIIIYDTLPAYCISKVVVMNLEKSFTRKYMYHLDHHRRFPSKIIGWKNWIQKSLDAAKTHNESNQNQKTNYQERWDPWVEWNPSKVACRCS